MDVKTIEWGRKIKDLYITRQGRILDIGSLNINGSFREIFPYAKEYVGIDIQEGEGVDVVSNAHDLTKCFKKKSFDIVICMFMLEHDREFWKTIEQINQVIKDEGYLLLGVPTFGFVEHSKPDYYRFSESAVTEVLLDKYDIIDSEKIFTKGKVNPVINYFAVKR